MMYTQKAIKGLVVALVVLGLLCVVNLYYTYSLGETILFRGEIMIRQGKHIQSLSNKVFELEVGVEPIYYGPSIKSYNIGTIPAGSTVTIPIEFELIKSKPILRKIK